MADNPKYYTVILYAHVYLFIDTVGGASFYTFT